MIFLSKIQKRLKFDDYMLPFLVLFGILYLMGAVKFLSMLTNLKGILIYIAYIFGGAIAIVLFLKFFQTLCQLLGVDKLYNNIRNKSK